MSRFIDISGKADSASTIVRKRDRALRRHAIQAALRTIGGVAICLLSSCAAYRSHPINLDETRTAFEARSLKDPELDDALHRLFSAQSYEMLRRDGWSVDALLIAAARLSPTLNETRAKVAAASAATITARSLPNPTLNLSSEYDLARAAESPWLWGFTTDFLLDGALRRVRAQIADRAVRSARLEYAEAIWSLRRELRAALLSVIVAEHRNEILSAALDDRQELARLFTRRVAEGEAPMSERLQAELELSRLRSQLAQARQAHRTSRANLANLIGIPINALDGERLRFDIQTRPALPDGAQFKELRDTALLSRPDLEVAIVEYQNRELELRKEVRSQYPTFTLGPGFTYDHGIRKATLGASFSLPLFNRNRGPIAEAEARRTLAARHLLSTQAQIFNEIDAARTEAEADIEAFSTARDQLTQAHSLVTSIERGVELGTEDRPTLLSARLAASNDEINLLDQMERTQAAIGRLEDALRTPFAESDFPPRFKLESLDD